jgi:hypothetical protein
VCFALSCAKSRSDVGRPVQIRWYEMVLEDWYVQVPNPSHNTLEYYIMSSTQHRSGPYDDLKRPRDIYRPWVAALPSTT